MAIDFVTEVMPAAAACRAPSPDGSPSLRPALSRAPAVSMTPLRRTMNAPSRLLNSLIVSVIFSSRTFRSFSSYPLNGLRIICSDCSSTR